VINPLDGMLRDLIQSRIPTLAGPTQVGFSPPNADWKAAVASAGEERLNLYLYDLRENLPLRSNELRSITKNGLTTIDMPSPRLDCTYLITAWSPVAVTPLLEPAREEHALLYRTLAVLMRARPLVAQEVYAVAVPSGMTFTAFETGARPLVDQPLPVSVAHPGVVNEPAEFWTTMKVDQRPAIHLTVTIPVVIEEPEALFPIVSTITGIYKTAGLAGVPDSVVSVGGSIAGTGNVPIPGAWVQIVGKNPPAIAGVRERTLTDSAGHFVFLGIPAGDYELDAVAPGVGAKFAQPFRVPVAGGHFELVLP
jgi:hypothetical protein